MRNGQGGGDRGASLKDNLKNSKFSIARNRKPHFRMVNCQTIRAVMVLLAPFVLEKIRNRKTGRSVRSSQ